MPAAAATGGPTWLERGRRRQQMVHDAGATEGAAISGGSIQALVAMPPTDDITGLQAGETLGYDPKIRALAQRSRLR